MSTPEMPESASMPGLSVWWSRRSPSFTMTRFSPVSATTSPIVAKATNPRQVEGLKPHGNRDSMEGKILMGKMAVQAQSVEQQQRILAAGNADSNFVSGLYQVKILIGPAKATESFLHKRGLLFLGYPHTVMLSMTEKDRFIVRNEISVSFTGSC